MEKATFHLEDIKEVIQRGLKSFPLKSTSRSGENQLLQERRGFPGGSMVNNLPANAEDSSSIPGSGRSPGVEMATHSSILAWEIP